MMNNCAACKGTLKIESELMDGTLSYSDCALCFGNRQQSPTNYAETSDGSSLTLNADINLTVKALNACGYRIHMNERAGTQWVTACKAPNVRYEHWHPLTNINQAMQLLIDNPGMTLTLAAQGTIYQNANQDYVLNKMENTTSIDLIHAACRAIVVACGESK